MSKRRTVGEELRALAVECGGRAGATPDDEAATLWRTASVEYAEAAKHLARYQDLERQVASIKMEYGAARRRAERAHNHAEARDGWVVLRADCGAHGRPVLAFRVVVRE